jgi:hypothetical protein
VSNRSSPTPHSSTPPDAAPPIDGRPALAWTTLARAERLAYRGLGWSPDHVLRQALDLFEREHLDPRPGAAGRQAHGMSSPAPEAHP